MTTMTQTRIDAARAEMHAVFTTAADVANALHAANGCSYCRRQAYQQQPGEPLFKPTRFDAEDISDDETGFEAQQYDSYHDRETTHFLTIPDRLLADPAALGEAIAVAQAAHDAVATKLLERAAAKTAGREREERATLRRLAERYPEELVNESAP